MFQPCFSNQLGDELRGNGKPPVHARENAGVGSFLSILQLFYNAHHA